MCCLIKCHAVQITFSGQSNRKLPRWVNSWTWEPKCGSARTSCLTALPPSTHPRDLGRGLENILKRSVVCLYFNFEVLVVYLFNYFLFYLLRSKLIKQVLMTHYYIRTLRTYTRMSSISLTVGMFDAPACVRSVRTQVWWG